ncbi:MAG: Protoporphyrinogen oxidase [Chlamydiae bacterium]|nr:Protoporphyrinogen oxidase [Chlamydiota bacterium]
MIVILGGGISGLSTAWYLRQKTNAKIILIEKTPRLGGRIQSVNEHDFFFERGPRSIRPHGGEETLRLIQHLGLQDQVVPGKKAAHQRYLYLNQTLRKLPSSLKDLITSPWLWPILTSLITEWTKKTSPKNDESIYEFISRRLNPKVADTLLDPMTSGIYAGNIHQLSMKSCFPKIYQYEKDHGSLTKGMLSQKKRIPESNPFICEAKKSSLYTLQNGLQELIVKLVEHLDIEIKLSCSVTSLIFDKQIHIETENETFIADHVISALPSQALGHLMKAHDPSIAQLLHDIPMTSLAVVNIGYNQPVLKKEGFGYLIPSSEKEEILGMVWDSSAFPTQNQHTDQTRLTVMIGGSHMQNFEHTSEEDFLTMSLNALNSHLGITETPDCVEVSIAHQAIPQYIVGHSERVREIETKIAALSSNFHFTGNCFYGVSVNDCILNAKKLVETHHF